VSGGERPQRGGVVKAISGTRPVASLRGHPRLALIGGNRLRTLSVRAGWIAKEHGSGTTLPYVHSINTASFAGCNVCIGCRFVGVVTCFDFAYNNSEQAGKSDNRLIILL
jgi:hypothetical protein